MEINKIAVIGAGISGLSIAHCLKTKYPVKIFERDSHPGGLIKCDRINGNLYHRVGGHVFNSQREDVLKWFWKFFDQKKEFTKAVRNSVICMPNGQIINYPIENHIYMMNELLIKKIIKDIISIIKKETLTGKNFEEFLLNRFGETLYKIYFKPYNEKIWKQDLTKIPLTWLKGKLPMPTPDEIIYNNIHHTKEMNMVHSSFYYPQSNGSQYIADKLAEGLNITYNSDINQIIREKSFWKINDESFDKVIFCGNIKDLPEILKGIDILSYYPEIRSFKYHGTTTVLCEIAANQYSWIYLPDYLYTAHRIICTGNFAASNNTDKNITTSTIEFTNYISKNDIEKQLSKIPFSPKYITHLYTEYTYPIQNENTRDMINTLKINMQKEHLYLLGRFAEWEYYNMDAAIGAAIDLSQKITT